MNREMDTALPPAAAIASSISKVPPASGGTLGGGCASDRFDRTGAALRRPGLVVAFIAAALSAGAAACDRETGGADSDEPSAPIVAFDTANVRIETAADTFQLRAEIAESDQQIRHGLMERDILAPDAGMLFLLTAPQEASTGFYMFRTRIPLDIAYIDENGRIVSIRTMQPCDSPNPQLCRSYHAGAEYSSVLEVNAGYFAEHGIDVGDRVVRLRE